jgi:hypothetical protein
VHSKLLTKRSKCFVNCKSCEKIVKDRFEQNGKQRMNLVNTKQNRITQTIIKSRRLTQTCTHYTRLTLHIVTYISFHPQLHDFLQSSTFWNVPRLCPIVLLVKATLKVYRWWNDTDRGQSWGFRRGKYLSPQSLASENKSHMNRAGDWQPEPCHGLPDYN